MKKANLNKYFFLFFIVIGLALYSCSGGETIGKYEIVDTDLDEISDTEDNCSLIENTDQLDLDEDGLGDVCDPCPEDAINICDCADADSDGYKDILCGGSDCDDNDVAIFPEALELCDGLDNDCDGEISENETDEDSDGFMICANDCNDNDSAINQDALEICNNGIDDDCDGHIDNSDNDCIIECNYNGVCDEGETKERCPKDCEVHLLHEPFESQSSILAQGGTVTDPAFVDAHEGKGIFLDETSSMDLYFNDTHLNTTSGTISFWYKPDWVTDSKADYTWMRLFEYGKPDSPDYGGIKLGFDNHGSLIIFKIKNYETQSEQTIRGHINWKEMKWHKIDAYWNETSMGLYVDYILIDEANLNFCAEKNYDKFAIGRRWSEDLGETYGLAKGTFDELYIYDKTFSYFAYSCGNNICNAGENRSNCPLDCGGDDEIILSDENMEISFSKGTGGIVNIIDKVRDIAYSPQNLAEYRLFELTYKEDLHIPYDDYKYTISNNDASLFSYSKSEAGSFINMTHVFDDLNIIVLSKISLDKENNEIIFEAEVDNRSEKLIQSFEYPIITLKPKLGDEEKDDSIVVPYAEGWLEREPYSLDDGYNVHMNDRNSYQPGIISMQFFAFYDNQAGIYMSSYDPEGFHKLNYFTRIKRAIEDSLVFKFVQIVSESSGNDIGNNYPRKIKFFKGDWHDAADIYKEWTKTQYWTEKKISEREDFPLSYINTDLAYMTYTVPPYLFSQTYNELLDNIENSGLSFDNISMMHIPGGGWSYHSDLAHEIKYEFAEDEDNMTTWSGIDYFEDDGTGAIPDAPLPNDMLTSEINFLKDKGVDTFLLLSGYKWDIWEKNSSGEIIFDDSSDYDNYGLNHTVVKEDGNEYVLDDTYSIKNHERYSAYIDINTDDNNIMDLVFLDNLRRAILRNATYVSYDQVVGGHFESCYDKEHEHPMGGGIWLTKRYKKLLEESNNLISDLDKTGEVGLCHENQNELFLPYLQMQWVRHTSYNNFVYGDKKIGLFNYLYNPYYLGIERGEKIRIEPEEWVEYDKEYLRLGIGMMYVQTTVPGHLHLTKDFTEKDIFNYFIKSVKFANKNLRSAEIINPPEIIGIPEEKKFNYRKNKSSSSKTYYYDELLCNAFKTEDNEIIYVFANVRDKTMDNIVIDFELSQYDLECDKFDVYLKTNGSESKALESVSLPMNFNLSIAPEDFVEVRVSSSNCTICGNDICEDGEAPESCPLDCEEADEESEEDEGQDEDLEEESDIHSDQGSCMLINKKDHNSNKFDTDILLILGIIMIVGLIKRLE